MKLRDGLKLKMRSDSILPALGAMYSSFGFAMSVFPVNVLSESLSDTGVANQTQV